jgi:hypothetical protein
MPTVSQIKAWRRKMNERMPKAAWSKKQWKNIAKGLQADNEILLDEVAEIEQSAFEDGLSVGRAEAKRRIRKLAAQLEQKPIRVSVKPDGQVWVVFNAGEGRKATLNLNNIVLAKESVGITKGIMLDAIAKALEEVK